MPLTHDKVERKIHDDLYGIIHLTKAESDIINSPHFQRLRKIKQLGLASLVFPGAEHTRFSHSIGVLGVAERVCRHLELVASDEKKIRMAALLHDIGHFPLSHTVEKVYKKLKKKATNNKLVYQIKSKGGAPTTQTEEGYDIKLHEELSNFIIKNTDVPDGITKILKKNKFSLQEIDEIANIVEGNHDKPLLNQLMHSDLDIDQIDYMNRDAKNAGIIYGMFDVDYLVESMGIIQYKNNPKTQILVIKQKGLGAVEDYVMAKYHYFTKILFHKTREAFELAARKVYAKMVEMGDAYNYEEMQRVIKNPKKVIYFSDQYFFDALEKVMKSNKYSREYKLLAESIIYRKKLKILEEKQQVVKKKNDGPQPQTQPRNKTKNYYYEEDFPICDNIKDICDDESGAFDNLSLPALFSARKPIRVQLKEEYRFTPKNYRIKGVKKIKFHIFDSANKITFLATFPDTIIYPLSNYKLYITRSYQKPGIHGQHT